MKAWLKSMAEKNRPHPSETPGLYWLGMTSNIGHISFLVGAGASALSGGPVALSAGLLAMTGASVAGAIIHSNKVLKLEKEYNLAKEREANIKKELAPKGETETLKPENDKLLEVEQSLASRHHSDNDARGAIASSVQSFRDRQEATSKPSAILPGK